jgi:hypothetical protein
MWLSSTIRGSVSRETPIPGPLGEIALRYERKNRALPVTEVRSSKGPLAFEIGSGRDLGRSSDNKDRLLLDGKDPGHLGISACVVS